MPIGRRSRAATLWFVDQVPTLDGQARQRTTPILASSHVDPDLVDIVTACRITPRHQQRIFAMRFDSFYRRSVGNPVCPLRQVSS